MMVREEDVMMLMEDNMMKKEEKRDRDRVIMFKEKVLIVGIKKMNEDKCRCIMIDKEEGTMVVKENPDDETP